MFWPQDWGFLPPQHRGRAVTTLTHGSCSPSPTPHPALVQIPEDTSQSYVFRYKHPKPIRHSTLKLMNSRPFAFLTSLTLDPSKGQRPNPGLRTNHCSPRSSFSPSTLGIAAPEHNCSAHRYHLLPHSLSQGHLFVIGLRQLGLGTQADPSTLS